MDDTIARLRAALAERYAIDSEIGSGGMATVYLAEDLRHRRRVAIKVLRPELAAALGPERFLREIEIAARLSHPNILPLHDSGEAGGFLYYVMPYVEGESLRARLDRGGPAVIGDAVRLLREVADALAHAHAHGVVHRDIKPDNVLLSGRHALIADFGVAKAVSDAGARTQLTTVGVSLGTPAYMAPEQAVADPATDHRADLYAFGVLAYELLTGRLPFQGPTIQAVLAAQLTERPRPLLELRPVVPAPLASAVMRCLQKDPGDRYQSADALLEDLEGDFTPATGVARGRGWKGWARSGLHAAARHPRRAAVAAAVVLLVGGAAVGGLRHGARLAWAKDVAIPRLRQLADADSLEEAYQLGLRVRALVPADTVMTDLWGRVTRTVGIRTDPPGARVFRRAYADDGAPWQYLGTTPIDSLSVPQYPDLSRYRFERAGYRTLEVAGLLSDTVYTLSDGRTLPPGMVRVPGTAGTELILPGLEATGALTVGSFLMDIYEVTNREYKRFVDSGGYRRPEFWDQPFELDGRRLSWREAMARFTDRTQRPGPATWEAGDYPAGQADYPVGGVSWYEAMAYARFAHRSLPTIYHWAWAAYPLLSPWLVPHSNLDARGPARVGSSGAVGLFGTYDMAGNVREWCSNADGAERYILGGGWNDPPYAFNDAFAQPPLDRSITNGIRLVEYLPGDSTLAAASRPVVRAHRDFSQERPVPAAIFDVYRRLYDYDRTPLHARIEESDSSAESWVQQRITFDAAYGNERVTAYLFLPKHGRPPYQTVAYFPGSDAIHVRSSRGTLELPLIDFLIKNGRAVVYPVYKGTYERGDSLASDYPDGSNFYKDHVIMWAKDLRRSLDYLETRPDMDTARIAYLGVSWGGFMGGLMPAVEPRIKAVVLYVAGLDEQRGRPEVEPVNFLPHITVPVLMLNGRYDWYFPVESAQLPFFRLLGTPPQSKRQVIYDGGHFLPRTAYVTETLAWLDRYLGPVR